MIKLLSNVSRELNLGEFQEREREKERERKRERERERDFTCRHFFFTLDLKQALLD